MKVVFATGIYPPDIGGPATYVSHLAPELARRGHEVEVVTYSADEASGAGRPPEGEAFTVRRVPREVGLPRRYLRYFAAVRRSGRGADLVYLQDPISAGVPGLAAAESRRIPTLLKVVGDLAWEISSGAGWVHDDIGVFQRRRYAPRVETLRRAQQLVARRVASVVVPSAYLAEVVQGWGVAPERLTIVENAAPPATSSTGRAEARRSFGLEDAFVIVSAGRLLSHKGFELLVAAAADVRRHVDRAVVLIAGDGPFRAALAAEIDRLRVGDLVRLMGTLGPADMEKLQRASDVFVLLSAYEGRSHVLLEAMQAGVPIVASDIPGNRELLDDYPDAFLVPRLVEAIAAAIRRVAGGGSGRERLPDPTRRSAAPWEDMVARTLRVMERTCG